MLFYIKIAQEFFSYSPYLLANKYFLIADYGYLYKPP